MCSDERTLLTARACLATRDLGDTDEAQSGNKISSTENHPLIARYNLTRASPARDAVSYGNYKFIGLPVKFIVTENMEFSLGAKKWAGALYAARGRGLF